MTPQVQEFPPLKLIGLKAELRTSKDAPNDMRVVPSLWQRMMPIAAKLPQRIDGKRYALITGDLPHVLAETAFYWALVAVSDDSSIPDGWESLSLPSTKIARFIHKGLPQTIGQTAKHALFDWLPQSGEALAEDSELFVYPEGYDREDPHGQFDYCLFLMK